MIPEYSENSTIVDIRTEFHFTSNQRFFYSFLFLNEMKQDGKIFYDFVVKSYEENLKCEIISKLNLKQFLKQKRILKKNMSYIKEIEFEIFYDLSCYSNFYHKNSILILKKQESQYLMVDYDDTMYSNYVIFLKNKNHFIDCKEESKQINKSLKPLVKIYLEND